ncbi:hypothetical protein [Chitinophaga sp. sic0106]|uniref:hypothetical protein n=1 Tax=Chitinophaga sp. sic0106 TaxID=2854785 RepID=UPI001C472D68|nr:hypothetical protein [Chitinophaga sp. sic0106]MBV7529001.1 hypothetical protein [Chitinophaga sp. sic0106]
MKEGNGIIYMVDKLVIGHNHVMFNASLTAIIASIYDHQQVLFVAEKLHSGLIASKNSDIQNLIFEPFEEDPLPGGKLTKLLPWGKKKIGDWMFISKYIKRANASDQNILIFTCLSASSLLYSAMKVRRKKFRSYFVLHGELEFIFQHGLPLKNKLKGWLYKQMLKSLGEQTSCIVLSDIIKRNLVASGLVKAENVIAVDHPVITRTVKYASKPKDPVVFGHLGIAMRKKRSEVFMELAQYFGQALEKPQPIFRLIGKMEPGFTSLSGNVEVIANNNQIISQQEYEKNIDDVDYAIFSFDNENYVYRVSGSLMDAICHGKPIICLKQVYINYLFEIAGNIGFLCENVEEMKDIIGRISRREMDVLEVYGEQQANLEKLMLRFSVDEICKQLEAQIR